MVKNLPTNVGDTGSIPRSERSPGGGNGKPPTSVFLPEKSHGQRSLADYSPWGHKESDTIEKGGKGGHIGSKTLTDVHYHI